MNFIWFTICVFMLVIITHLLDSHIILNTFEMFYNKLKAKKQSVNNKKTKNAELEKQLINDEETVETEKLQDKKVLDKVDPILTSEYAQYTVLDYSIRVLSYPEEETRYYAVVSLTGGKLKDNIANVIIHYTGGYSDSSKENLWNYSLVRKPRNNPYLVLTVFDCERWNYTFDAVKRMLNKYIKDKNNGEEQIGSDYWKAYDKEYAYYFDTKEDALFALCQFKKIIDERYRKKALSVNDISETEIKVTFTD